MARRPLNIIAYVAMVAVMAVAAPAPATPKQGEEAAGDPGRANPVDRVSDEKSQSISGHVTANLNSSSPGDAATGPAGGGEATLDKAAGQVPDGEPITGETAETIGQTPAPEDLQIMNQFMRLLEDRSKSRYGGGSDVNAADIPNISDDEYYDYRDQADTSSDRLAGDAESFIGRPRRHTAGLATTVERTMMSSDGRPSTVRSKRDLAEDERYGATVWDEPEQEAGGSSETIADDSDKFLSDSDESSPADEAEEEAGQDDREDAEESAGNFQYVDGTRPEVVAPEVETENVADQEQPALQTPPYIPVVYHGVNGIFIPEAGVSRKKRSVPDRSKVVAALSEFDPKMVEAAAAKWSQLVREEVKKALDEYDLVYRLAGAIRKARNN